MDLKTQALLLVLLCATLSVLESPGNHGDLENIYDVYSGKGTYNSAIVVSLHPFSSTYLQFSAAVHFVAYALPSAFLFSVSGALPALAYAISPLPGIFGVQNPAQFLAPLAWLAVEIARAGGKEKKRRGGDLFPICFAPKGIRLFLWG